jgi:uncharacterized protein (TIGR00369 family)
MENFPGMAAAGETPKMKDAHMMKEIEKDFQKYVKIPKGDDHHCFGCSPINPHGLQMDFYYAEKTVFSWLSVPEHLCGWNNLLHGGVIATILDEIMSWTAIYILKKFILTKKMTVEFIKPLTVGTKLTAKGMVFDIISEREAVIDGFLFDDRQRLCARSKGTYALLGADTAKKLKVVDEDAIRRFTPVFEN